MEDVELKIRQAICKISAFPEGNITLDSKLEEVGIDSFAGIDLVFTLEDIFNITISDSEMNQIRTVRDAVEAVQRRFESS